MSKNQKHQDIIEHRCLNFVKNNLERKDSFGVSDKQYIQLQKILNEAIPNSNSNEFPDFIFDNGFIEHFAVTSSLENKKGSKQKKESNIFKNRSQKNFLSNLEKNNSDIRISNSYMKPMEEHSHTYIVNSIKKNWKKHMQSYDKNINSLNKGIFIIEYIDEMIQTAFIRENEPANVYDTYRISGDKDMLEWIYKYKVKIEYLVFANLISESIEVIKINNIPDIINNSTEAKYQSVIAFESHKYSAFKFEY